MNPLIALILISVVKCHENNANRDLLLCLNTLYLVNQKYQDTLYIVTSTVTV